MWKLQNPPTAPVKPGARFNVKLLAAVQEGWHLYSLKPMAEGPVPTRIWLAEGQPFSLAGAVQAPEPQVMQDASFGMEVELYEGEAVFALPVQSGPGRRSGPAEVGRQRLLSVLQQQDLPAAQDGEGGTAHHHRQMMPPAGTDLPVPRRAVCAAWTAGSVPELTARMRRVTAGLSPN